MSSALRVMALGTAAAADALMPPQGILATGTLAGLDALSALSGGPA